MKIYTKTGDKGQTGIIGGRVDKDDIRVEAYGTVDELNGFVGQAITELEQESELFSDVLEDLVKIQHELFDCGGDLASVAKKRPLKLHEGMIEYLEERIDVLVEEAPKLERFILPGGTKPAATIHIARTITRRAERLVVSLIKQDDTVPAVTLQYLNRLSDYFFALARVINFRLNVPDVEYVRSAKVFREGRKKDK
ncbi:cob(I)yrinic acid a,c-diamide adenosyltransferase [Virgibacillus sp. MSJ-26]|uniref:cob(I)yrinic acid a,c-diamide adenosyltransferase n=1 Tax=Virgibacillus sp. MSJ-26 TaxID=2841522 RepID=UPI001C1265E9|nr:cob(I)yrinic acid a,c-diamide adenosyltransferase [Virgibacillus sp. MSJ-26]MBU5467160.1 cob(I)yrinic acid a,c-diamide adenosyltransferase [Virgibacillus sp. MSJ-26]